MLVLKKRQKTLEEIIPVWAARIKECGGIAAAILKYKDEYMRYSRCLLGEAHGFNLGYARDGSGCPTCITLSYTSPFISNSSEGRWIDDFLEHWNTTHVGTEHHD